MVNCLDYGSKSWSDLSHIRLNFPSFAFILMLKRSTKRRRHPRERYKTMDISKISWRRIVKLFFSWCRVCSVKQIFCECQLSTWGVLLKGLKSTIATGLYTNTQIWFLPTKWWASWTRLNNSCERTGSCWKGCTINSWIKTQTVRLLKNGDFISFSLNNSILMILLMVPTLEGMT